MNIEIPTNLSESAAAEIQAIIDREKAKVGAFMAKDGEKYWFINLYGKGLTEILGFVWESHPADKMRFITGNCHPTGESALAAASAYFAKIDAEFAIKRWLAEHQDWLSTDAERANATAMKFYVMHRREEGCSVLVVKGWSFFEPLGVTNFRTCEHANQFIQDCGEHLRVVHGLPREEVK